MHRAIQRRQKRGLGRERPRVSQGRFRVVGCGAFHLDFEGGLGSEAEGAALFFPVMRQVFAQSQQPGRRQRNGMPEIVSTSKRPLRP
jgi:hypothetical protein